MLTTSELAAALRISDRTVYRLVSEGLPHFRVRKQLRFRLERVEEWLECRSEETNKGTGTSRFASDVSGFTNAFGKVRLRVMPSESKPKSG